MWIGIGFMLLAFVGCRGSVDVDTTCKDDFKKLEKCYLTKLTAQVKEKTKQYQESIGDCFSSHKGCQAPAFDQDPLSEMPRIIRKIIEKVKEEWGNTSIKVKQCIRNYFTEEIGIILNSCLSKRGIHQINVSQFAETFAENGGTDFFGEFLNDRGNGSQDTWQAFLIGRVNVARAFRECEEVQQKSKKHTNESLDQCGKVIFAHAKSEFCNETTQCRNDASNQCNTRAEQVYQVGCDCKYEKILDIIQHLDQLLKRRSVTVTEMIKAAGTGQDPRKYINATSECYKKYRQKVPSILRVIDQLTRPSSDDNTGPAGKTDQKGSVDGGDDWGKYTGDRDATLGHAQPPPIDKSLIITIRDFLASQAFNKDECVPCAHD